jgi:hypothetical protein
MVAIAFLHEVDRTLHDGFFFDIKIEIFAVAQLTVQSGASRSFFT